MEFTVPTTKTAMYNTLKEIFYYYRIKRAEYEAVTLEELSIPRESYTAPTAAEYEAKAKALCAPAQELRLVAYKDGIQKEISALSEKKKKIAAALAETEEKINAAYAEATERVKNEAAKRGLSDSALRLRRLRNLRGKRARRSLRRTRTRILKPRRRTRRYPRLTQNFPRRVRGILPFAKKRFRRKSSNSKTKKRRKRGARSVITPGLPKRSRGTKII